MLNKSAERVSRKGSAAERERGGVINRALYSSLRCDCSAAKCIRRLDLIHRIK